MRSVEILGSVAIEVSGSQVVGENEDDVRVLLGRLRKCWEKTSREDETSAESDPFEDVQHG